MTKLHIAVIGGGAAGFFAAIAAKTTNSDAEVTIYERAQKVLAKVAVTGGGRCNLTNSFEQISDLKQAYPRGFRLMKRLFSQFDHHDACRWFEDRGVELVTQEDQCVFPKSQDAMQIVNCLTAEARRLGVVVKTGMKLEAITAQNDGAWRLMFAGGMEVVAQRVAVTTGGMPHRPDFLQLSQLGHRCETPMPALFTFNISDPAFTSLMGTVADPVVVTIPSTKFKARGALLITHWGMSGPAILKLSSHAARYLCEHNYQAAVAVNWAGDASRDEVERVLGDIVVRHPQKQLGSLRPSSLPTRLWLYMLHKLDIPEDRRWAELGKKTINRLIELLTNDLYMINGRGSFREEFVTCGGVALDGIDSNTLESRHCKGLYFAGEVLDIDAITGGFNLQAAWTTGYVVGRHIV